MVMVLLGVVLGGASGASGADAPAPCTTGKLKVYLGGGSGGAAGSVYEGLNFVNEGSAACTLRGYPGVSDVSASGRELGSPASRVRGVHIKTVTLKRGGSVKAAVGLTDTGLI